jgi:hypothetical protein
MVAIIKKNFRLQNARDFLEALNAHPRMANGVAAPLEESDNLIVAAPADGALTTSATYTWTWPISNTVSDRTQNSPELKKDSLYGLKEQIGTHIDDRNHYLFIGKSTTWKPEDWPGNTQLFNSLLDPSPELAPKPALDTIEEERRVWDEMIGLKKISELTASLVVPRSDWDGAGRTVYRIFDDRDPNLYSPPTVDDQIRLIGGRSGLRVGNFYALNSEYDLFVCIETGVNADGLPNVSTEEPRRTQTPGELIDYSAIDGYVWKYITTIKQADVTKFTTDQWIPIKTLIAQEIKASEIDEATGGISDPQATVQTTAKPGSVLSFVVDNTASQIDSYTTTHTGIATAFINSTTESSVATLNVDPSLGNNPPQLSPNNNAYGNMHIYITSVGRGYGEVYTISAYNAQSNQITLAADEKWSTALTNPTPAQETITVTYDILPIVTVQSNGTTPVKLKPVVSNGRISRVKVVDPGENASTVIVTVNQTSGLNSGKEAAKVRAILGPTRGLGADPEKDLGAFFVMLNAKLAHDDSSGDFPLSNDYRQLGIIRDVRKPDNKLATDDTLNACEGLSVQDIDGPNPVTPFISDEIVVQRYTNFENKEVVARARLIEFKEDPDLSGAYIIRYIQTPETGYEDFVSSNGDANKFLFSERKDANGNILQSSLQGSCEIRSTLPAELKKFNGEILYLENRRAVLRAKEQTEDIKAIIEF